ncbi:MAG: ParB/RepB/Spo0J family partition protein [Candidatus Sungiibacteriota bacterium]|uniref:ParB/RepB/Spo0J family partition protein n=1 Tax=Candidatus Sungiibacteriota bacterium TaxID=2750080 RepID=A0A7T5RIZ3_9BACT|nr:MAG: ParB/RepB/Spo0J family partition protein [Candidatus Sungbacteria bacterium]
MPESLGRGLESLIPDKPPEEMPENFDTSEAVLPSAEKQKPKLSSLGEGSRLSYEDHFTPRRSDSVFWIEVEKIEPNPFQPRREFEESTLKDLAGSIREHGVLQPILVTKREIETPGGIDVRYQLIAGERRWRAARLAGLTQIPAVIRRGMPDDRLKLELALIENVQREDLNPLERARAFKQLIDEFHLVQREIGERVGKSREFVANTIRLLALPNEIQEALHAGKITEGHARAVLIVGDDPTKQSEVYNAVVMDRLTVREAENKARQVSGKVFVPRRRPAAVQDPEMREWKNRLEEKLGTKVQLQKIGERGKIVVEFYSEEELRGILGKLIREA